MSDEQVSGAQVNGGQVNGGQVNGGQVNGEQVKIRLALRELVDRYGLAVDRRDAQGFGDLFTATGSLEILEPGARQPSLTYTGTAEIQSVIDLVTRYAGTFHLMANHLVTIEGADRARGTVYCLAHHLSRDETRDTLMLIRYEDDYVCEQGVWRFARRQVMRQWSDTLAADRLPLVTG